MRDVVMTMNLTPKQAVVHAFPRHGGLDTERIVALLQYLFKEGFVVARRRKELGLPD